jgi:sulfur-carrier protein adenylyltransferase/sulfurtransferase
MNLARYARQTILSEVGLAGQTRLKKTRVICIGVGGLGAPATLYLAAAGVGTLGIVDFDRVDEINLQRQILFDSTEVGKLKVDVAKRRLEGLNPEVLIETYPCGLTAGNALKILSHYDIVIDGTDNFAAKFLINDAAVRLGLPVVYGSISRFEGQVSVFWAKHGPCYRCLYPVCPDTPVMNCAESGVLGAIAGIIGSMQAAETIKLAIQGTDLGPLAPLLGRLFVLDCATMAPFIFQVPKKTGCPACSIPVDQIHLSDLTEVCVAKLEELSVMELMNEIGRKDKSVALIDVREAEEWHDGHIPGAVNVPLSLLSKTRTLPAGLGLLRRVVVYCQSGMRSRQAARIFIECGVPSVAHLRGGMVAWAEVM